MSETIYALYPVFVGSDDLRDVLDDTDDRRDAAAGDREPVQVVGGHGPGARHLLDGRVPRRRRPDAVAPR